MNKQMSSALAQGDNTPVVLIVEGKQEFMGNEIPVVVGGFGKDNKIIADKTIAEIHNMETRNVRARITDNIKRFKSGIDFIDLKEGAYQTSTLDILLNLGYTKSAITQAEHIYILSERGYSKLIKIMDTDLAWEIHDKLVDDYFTLREKVKNQRQDSYIINDPIERAKAWIIEQQEKQQLQLENAQQQQIIGELKPKATYYDLVLQSPDLMTITLIAKDYGMSGAALNKKLHELGVQYFQSGVWLLYAQYHGLGYTYSKTQSYQKQDGTQGTKLHTQWTQKGRLFIYSLLKQNGILPMIERGA